MTSSIDLVDLLITCPSCGERHIDEGEFATRLHHTHACQFCGMVWRPAIGNTRGVRFLPGFHNESPKPVCSVPLREQIDELRGHIEWIIANPEVCDTREHIVNQLKGLLDVSRRADIPRPKPEPPLTRKRKELVSVSARLNQSDSPDTSNNVMVNITARFLIDDLKKRQILDEAFLSNREPRNLFTVTLTLSDE